MRYTEADFDWLTPLQAPSVHHGQGTGVQDQPGLVQVVEAYGSSLTQKSDQEWHGPPAAWLKYGGQPRRQYPQRPVALLAPWDRR